MTDLAALRPGTILADDYRIERTLGAGGFGITYLAEEISLARLVTIKEYFPLDFAARDSSEDVVPRSQESEGDYAWGLDRFLAEAQTLAKFTHPNIVRVYRYFLARNTGYIVLHYEQGKSLKGWLKSLGRAPRQPELDKILEPLLDALETVHAADYLHRDIAPDNIMIRPDGQPVLIDFGSARGDIAKHSKTISALVKPGYSAYEQYATTSRQQGPWTDIYSLGATLYEAVTGRRPVDAPTRMVADDMIPPADAALSSYRPQFLAAIAKALRLEIPERPKSIKEWRVELLAPSPAPPPKRSAKLKTAPPPPVDTTAASPAASAAAPPVAGAATTNETPAAVASEVADKRVAATSPEKKGGLAAAFLDGWRKGQQSDEPQGRTPGDAPPPAAVNAIPKPQSLPSPPPKVGPETPDLSVAKARNWFGRTGSSKPKVSAPQDAAALPVPLPAGARKATPRSIRKPPRAFWRRIAVQLALALVVAGTVVALQDHFPTIRREGAGLLTSQIGVDVPIEQLRGHKGAVSGLAFSDDGLHVISAAMDGTIRVFDVARKQLIRTIELDAGAASAFAVTKGRAATGHRDGTIALWSVETGTKLATFKRSEAAISALSFAGRPDRIAVAAQDRTITLWDVSQPAAPSQLLDIPQGQSRALAFSKRGPFIAAGSADTTVKLWKMDSGDLIRTYRGHDGAIGAIAFDAEGRTLASGGSDGQIRLWSTYSNRMKRRIKAHDGNVQALAFSPDGAHIVSGGADGTLKIWDADRGRMVKWMRGGMGAIAAIDVSPDGRRIAAAGTDGQVRLFDTSVSRSGS